MVTIFIIFILLSYIINSAMDAIDNMKGIRYLFEFWHILKAASYAIPYASILYLVHAKWWIWIILPFVLSICWEIGYRFFRYINLYKLDDKICIKWLRVIWGISNTGRDNG